MKFLSIQVGYSLALVQSSKQNGSVNLSIKPLLSLTGLIFWLWSVTETMNRFHTLTYDWLTALSSLFRSVDMILDVYLLQLEILFSSFRYGFSL